MEKKYGPRFLPQLKKMGCTPQRYVYALKLTKLGLDKLVDAEYGDALFLFKKAYGIVPSPNLLFYQGMTHKGRGDLLRARERFKTFLITYPHWNLTKIPRRRVERAAKELKRIEGQLATLKIITPKGGFSVRVKGEKRAVTPMKRPLWLYPGRVAVSISRAGYVERRFSVELKAGSRVERKVELITEADRVRVNRLKAERREKAKAALLKRRLEVDAAMKKYTYRKRILATIGWSVLIAGGAAVLASAYYGVASIAPSDKVENSPRDTAWVDVKRYYDQAEAYKTNSRVLGVAGGLLSAAGGIILLYCHQFLRPPVNSRVTLTGSPAGLTFTYRF